MADESPPPDAAGAHGSSDPFPRDRVSVMVHRMPNYLKLAWRLGKDPMLSRARRAAVIAAAGYVISPVDLVALRLALDGLHPDRRRAHLEAVGLSDAHLADDLRTVGATTAWIARSGIRLSGRLLHEAAILGEEGAGLAAGAALRIGSGLGKAARTGWTRRPRSLPRRGGKPDA